METSSSWKLQHSSYTDWGPFLPREDWVRGLSWHVGNMREGLAVFPVPQTPLWARDQYRSHLLGGWLSGELVKGTQGERFSPTESHKTMNSKLAGVGYCERFSRHFPPLFHISQDQNQTNQSRKPLSCWKGPKSTFSSFGMWADFQKLNPPAVPLSLRETWSNIWLQMVVCEM